MMDANGNPIMIGEGLNYIQFAGGFILGLGLWLWGYWVGRRERTKGNWSLADGLDLYSTEKLVNELVCRGYFVRKRDDS